MNTLETLILEYPLLIKPGNIEIFGRTFLVNGCDKFTHDYYMQSYGYDFPLSSLNFEDEPRHVGRN